MACASCSDGSLSPSFSRPFPILAAAPPVVLGAAPCRAGSAAQRFGAARTRCPSPGPVPVPAAGPAPGSRVRRRDLPGRWSHLAAGVILPPRPRQRSWGHRGPSGLPAGCMPMRVRPLASPVVGRHPVPRRAAMVWRRAMHTGHGWATRHGGLGHQVLATCACQCQESSILRTCFAILPDCLASTWIMRKTVVLEYSRQLYSFSSGKKFTILKVIR
jgi:hypothetical protein